MVVSAAAANRLGGPESRDLQLSAVGLVKEFRTLDDDRVDIGKDVLCKNASGSNGRGNTKGLHREFGDESLGLLMDFTLKGKKPVIPRI